ncbi:unnamed protein product [Blepharisma stoltei]|uniref:Palmitoyltransferase n=1 Tax=Blepharisma stoltei TaxID=1481888 RepID=A0AAU9JJV7_9CILI|nr:unnamed protein product [Blepharisma stoltei]
MEIKYNKEIWYVISVLVLIAGVSSTMVSLSPKLSNKYESPMIIITLTLSIINMLMIIRIAVINPGTLIKMTNPPEEPVRIIEVFGNTILLKTCSTCNIIKPPRAHHCKICNVCIDRRDHHCHWVANCIGRNNHRMFIFLLFFLVVQCVFTIGNSIYMIAWIVTDTGLYIIESVLIAIGVLCLWHIGGLLIYHTFLIFTNQTTYEHKKTVFPSGNPFYKSFFKNCTLFWKMVPEENIKEQKPESPAGETQTNNIP